MKMFTYDISSFHVDVLVSSQGNKTAAFCTYIYVYTHMYLILNWLDYIYKGWNT